jgi:hypothetical protein
MIMTIVLVSQKYFSTVWKKNDGPNQILPIKRATPVFYLANFNSIYSVSFFLGEEALVDFSDVDGLYGSKHLAKAWSSTTTISSKSYTNFRTELDRIHLFVLLDLLGSASPRFKSFSVCLRLIQGD